MKTHNYVFIQIVWCIFGYDVIQTICFFFLEKSSRLLWAKKQAHVSSAVGAYWNPCVLNRKFNKKWNNHICPFILLPHGSFRLSNILWPWKLKFSWISHFWRYWGNKRVFFYHIFPWIFFVYSRVLMFSLKATSNEQDWLTLALASVSAPRFSNNSAISTWP